MFKTARHKKILEIIEEKQDVSVSQLRDLFGLSVVTIRSDLNELQNQKKIERTHGGAIAIEKSKTKTKTKTVEPFIIRKGTNGKKKAQIAKAASKLVKSAEAIYIDGGTTAAEMRNFLINDVRTTIITPSIDVAYWLGIESDFNIYVLNGFVDRDSLTTVSVPNRETLERLNISKAFVGAAGFTLEDGLTDMNMGYIEQKKEICKKARIVVGMIDSTKLGVVSLASFVDLEDIDVIITDQGCPTDLISKLEERQITVIIA